MSRIFVNYRRVDSDFAASQVAKYLKAEFGEDQVFFDVKNIQSGDEWAKVIRSALRKCDIFIVVIRSNWLAELKRRTNSPDPDWVRIEIQYALENKLKIFPLLIDAQMPSPNELPTDIQELTKIQDIGVRYRYFDADIIALKQAITPIMNPAPRLNISQAGVVKTDVNTLLSPTPSTLPEFLPSVKKPSDPLNNVGTPNAVLAPILRSTQTEVVFPVAPVKKKSNSVVSKLFNALNETERWKTWGLIGLGGVLAVVVPITAISSLVGIVGWGGIVLGTFGGIMGGMLGIGLTSVVLHTSAGTIIGLLIGAVGGAAVGIVLAIVNKVPVGITAVNLGKDASVVVGIICTILGLLSGISSQLRPYSRYSNSDSAGLAAFILGTLGVILGIAIAIDAWGPGIPLGDAVAQLLSTVLFWGVLLGVIGAVIGVAAGVVYDKLS
jgi:hypothetical protein